MATLGFPRKELQSGGLCCPSDKDNKEYENEIIYPCLNLEGPTVKASGIDGDPGDMVECVIKARIARCAKGDKEYGVGNGDSLKLEIHEISDVKQSEKSEEGESEIDDDAEDPASKALGYNAKRVNQRGSVSPKGAYK